MTAYNWLCLLGIPSLIGLLVGAVFKKFQADIDKQKKETEAVKKGIQALLRADMIKDYNHYTQKGFAPIYAKDNFENVYKNYHSLGCNGVMDSLYETFMNLPTEETHAD